MCETSLLQNIYDNTCQLIVGPSFHLLGHVVTYEQGHMGCATLNGMGYAAAAEHSSRDGQGCISGTRTDVLLLIDSWLMDK